MTKTQPIVITQIPLGFEAEKDNKISKLNEHVENLEGKLFKERINTCVEGKLRIWKRNAIVQLLISIPVVIILIYYAHVFKTESSDDDGYKYISSLIGAILVGGYNIFVFGLVFYRFFHDSNIEAKRKRFEIECAKSME